MGFDGLIFAVFGVSFLILYALEPWQDRNKFDLSAFWKLLWLLTGIVCFISAVAFNTYTCQGIYYTVNTTTNYVQCSPLGISSYDNEIWIPLTLLVVLIISLVYRAMRVGIDSVPK